VAARLFKQFFQFDFFQAVRILEQLTPERVAVGRAGPPALEVVRFKAHASLSFPPSVIANLTPPTVAVPVPAMSVPFMGLTGPSGVLPRHYTEMLLRVEKELKTKEKHAFRDWLDLFNHRFISLFFRAWEKYRYDVNFARRRPGSDNELFAHAILCLVGVGMPSLQQRLRVAATWEQPSAQVREERVLAKVENLAMVYYSGLLSHRPRNALGLEALIHDYFALPVRVLQFQGHWVQLEDEKQSRLGDPSGYALLGSNAVVGERVWDVQGKVRLRVGPLSYERYEDLLPDREPFPERKSFFELSHLVRFYAGVEMTFDVQLVLMPDEVPECRLADGTGDGPQLGWNTWLQSQSFAEPVDDAVFDGDELVWVNRV
jgi:type VI secretion system protein ImpH